MTLAAAYLDDVAGAVFWLAFAAVLVFLGSVQDNIDDKVSKGRARGANSGRTHCEKGHELTEDNRRYVGGKSRGCLTCWRAYQRQWCANKKEAGRGAA